MGPVSGRASKPSSCFTPRGALCILEDLGVRYSDPSRVAVRLPGRALVQILGLANQMAVCRAPVQGGSKSVDPCTGCAQASHCEIGQQVLEVFAGESSRPGKQVTYGLRPKHARECSVLAWRLISCNAPFPAPTCRNKHSKLIRLLFLLSILLSKQRSCMHTH